MTRSIFGFSRFRASQWRHGPNYYRDGETATATATTTTDSHEGGFSTSNSNTSNSSSAAPIARLVDPSHELDELARPPPPPRKSTNKRTSSSESVTSQKEHPPSKGVLLDLHNTIDFLTIKLQQSESQIKDLQAQNIQLQSFLEEFLTQQDAKLIGKQQPEDGPSEKSSEATVAEQSTGFFGLSLKWPFATTSIEEEQPEVQDLDHMAVQTDLGKTKATNSVVVFTKQDAMSKLTSHYQQQVVKLVVEKNELQQQLQQMEIQNRIQGQTISSMENQITPSTRRQHSGLNSVHRTAQDSRTLPRSTSSRASSSKHYRHQGHKSVDGRHLGHGSSRYRETESYSMHNSQPSFSGRTRSNVLHRTSRRDAVTAQSAGSKFLL